MNNQEISVDYKYSGFWIRFAAVLLDSLVIMLFSILVSILSGAGFREPSVGVQLVQTVVGLIYYIVLTVKYGQTLGKMAVGIRVISVSGGSNTWGSILLRETLAKIMSSLILLIGYIMAGFDSKKRALHDRIAGTYVIRAR